MHSTSTPCITNERNTKQIFLDSAKRAPHIPGQLQRSSTINPPAEPQWDALSAFYFDFFVDAFPWNSQQKPVAWCYQSHATANHTDNEYIQTRLHLNEAPTTAPSLRHCSCSKNEIKISETARYHDLTNDGQRDTVQHICIQPRLWQNDHPTPERHSKDGTQWRHKSSLDWWYEWQALSQLFLAFPMTFTITAYYHDAKSFIFTISHINPTTQLCTTMLPKRLSTMMLQIPDFFYIFHGISHEIHQNSSIPRCYKWHALSQFGFTVFSM